MGTAVTGIGGLFCIGITGFMFRHIAHKRRRAKEHLPGWQYAVHRWNHVYYCFRDDIIFDPETGESCHPGNFYEFLYTASQKAKRQLPQ